MKNLDVFPAEIVRCELEEEIDKRTLGSKTYRLGENKYRMRKAMGAIHYKDSGIQSDDPWKEIDLTIKENGDHYAITSAPYNLKIYKGKIKYSYISRQTGRVDVELKAINDTPVNNIIPHLEVVDSQENRVIWKNPVEGIDFFISAKSLAVSLYKSIKDKDAPKKFSWDVFEDISSNASFKQKTNGWDKSKQNMDISNNIKDKGIKTSEETGNKYRHLVFTEDWSGKVAKVKDRRTRIKEWATDVVYPAVIDADVSENITANVDDGNQVGIAPIWYSGTGACTCFYVGYYKNGADIAMDAGVRFRTIGIPQGATIHEAELKLQVKTAPSNNIATKIYGDDVDDASLWSDYNLPLGITKTTANTAWTPTTMTAPYTQYISMTDIVQEIISRPSWASSNDMRFAILNKLTGVAGANTIQVYDYNRDQAHAAVLQIEYTGVAPPANPLIGKPFISPDIIKKAKIR